MPNKEDNPHFKECWECGIWVSDQEGEHVAGRWFCDDGCFENYLEDKEYKAEGYECIRRELGLSKKTSRDKVIEEVDNVKDELMMRKEGFK